MGKNFTSKDAALKAFKDTFSFVGKRQEDIKREVMAEVSTGNQTNELAKQLEQIRKDMFYKDNPQIAPYRAVIEKIGGNPSDVVNAPEFKEILSKAQGYDESQKLRTVLESNPRIVSSKTKLDQARDMVKQTGVTDQVSQLATDAVLEAYGFDK